MAKFKFLIGDVNYAEYGGKWWRRVGDRRFHVMELINMKEACGDDVDYTYNVSLSEIDLWEVPYSEMVEAYRCCHWDGLFGEDDAEIYELTETWRELDRWSRLEKSYYAAYLARQFIKKIAEIFENILENEKEQLVMVEMLDSYGLKAPLWDDGGNNYRKLMKECREYSDAMDDPYERDCAMNRVVNKVGSTARDFMQGDLMSGMNQYFKKGIYAEISTEINMGGQIFTGVQANVKMNNVPSDDPLAYVAGYMDALSRKGMGNGSKKSELAEAYIEGFRYGVSVRKGDEPKPVWHG